MGRIKFPKGKQSEWINNILLKNQGKVDYLSGICGVSSRTIRDWRREKFTISEKALLKLKKKFSVPFPSGIKYIPDFWYVIKGARKGALKRLEIYGPLGTPEGRKKGGRISQLRRRLHPELYPNCIKRKIFVKPEKSTQLAESTGIILGDGGITDYQLKISLNKETEPEYIEFVTDLFKDIFKEKPQKYYYGNRAQKVCLLCLGGIELIHYLNDIGLNKGSKVLRQAEVPKWVKENKEYSIACLRGLADTDGCIYYHKHSSYGFRYFNLGWTFTNHSKPLLEFAYITLLNNGFTPKIRTHSVYLYRESEVVKYFDIIGSHNQHHLRRLEYYKEIKKQKEEYSSG